MATRPPRSSIRREFDARQIVRAAKAAGIKGMVIDAKHHGGFCLWPSKFNDNYSVKNCPWKNGKGDMVGNWPMPAAPKGSRSASISRPGTATTRTTAQPAYVEYYQNQLRELLTNYGPTLRSLARRRQWWRRLLRRRPQHPPGGPAELLSDQKMVCHSFASIQPEAMIFSDMGPDVRWNGNEHGVSGEHSDGTAGPPLTNGLGPHGNTGQLNRGDRDGNI